MSKELEALKRLYEDSVVYGEYLYELDLLGDKSYLERIDKDYDLLKQALKRNEPMKIKRERISLGRGWYRFEQRCPICNFETNKGEYCLHCGQKLDWSE